MREYTTSRRKQPATAGLRAPLARLIGEAILDGIDEEQLSANLKFAGATEAELEAAVRKWRSYAGSAVIL